MPADQFDREDLVRGINAVIAKLSRARQRAGIRIVGGAALALRYFDRSTTADVDAQLQPEQPILDAAVEVANEFGWPHDWLNSNAAMFLPSYGADLEWELLYADGTVTVEVASPKALLAMKLNASRPGRDVQDIANLLAICDIRDLDRAERLLNDFYPGDGLTDRAARLLIPIFAQGLPEAPTAPRRPIFTTDGTRQP